MKPPAGRLDVGDQVETRGRRPGRVVGERLIASNGAWSYTVVLDDGSIVEALDYELRRVERA